MSMINPKRKTQIKYEKIGGNIVITVPFYTKRFNPYMIKENGEPEDVGEYQTLIGIICKDIDGNDEVGFAEQIDMSYKDKGDQWTDIKYHFWEDKEDFIKLCKELGIDCFEYPTCAYCGKSIYSSFTIGDKGNMCPDCEDKDNKNPLNRCKHPSKGISTLIIAKQ